MNNDNDPDPRFALGYRVENREAPPEERRFVALNPELQAKAEKIFREMHEDAVAPAVAK